MVQKDRAVLAAHLARVDAAHRVAEEVRRLVPAQLQALVGAIQLVGHGGQHPLARVFQIGVPGDSGR